MTLVSIPANPVPEDVVTGTIKTPDGAELRFARWAPPAGRKGTVCVFTGRSEQIEKYFETVRDLRDRGFAVAMIDWRGQGHSSRRLRDPRKGYVRDFSDYRSGRRNLRAAGGAAGLPAAVFRAGAFDGRRGDAARRACGQTLVRPHGAVGADDRPARPRTSFPARALLRLLRFAGQGGRYVPGGSDALTGVGILRQQSLHQRSRALRPQRRDPRGRPDARHRLADGGLGRYRVQGDARLSRFRLSFANSPADPDAGRQQRHHRLDAGDRGVRLSSARRFASGHRRLEARNPAGAGPLPRAILGGVRCLRAGHAAVQVDRLDPESSRLTVALCGQD